MTTTLSDQPVAHNAKRLLWAGFLAILATGIGFGVRGGILANWAAEFGFTGAQLGDLGGAGLTGFCFGIIIGGVVVDKIGYGKLVCAAFVFHILSALITFAAHKGQPQDTAYMLLYSGTFVFALANGTLEAVANPLVATLFPNNRTHYLNILHAAWPAGLVLGGVIGWTMGGEGSNWKMQLGLFLVPTVLYGIAFMGQSFPKSEAAAKGLDLGDMMKEVGMLGALVACAIIGLFFKSQLGPVLSLFTHSEFFVSPTWGYISWGVALVLWLAVAGKTGFAIGSILLFILFITHALVGAVELGTDGWIQNITGNILTPKQGNQLFVFTSLLMFLLRFCAHFIESKLKISPVAMLVVCAILAAIGLNLVSGIITFPGALMALAVYALGKTFFWPTMLAIVGDRFPRTGAVAMSIMGGIGMMSAGVLGGPGLGYAKDRFTVDHLKETNVAVYEANKSDKAAGFMFLEKVQGLDGTKLAAAQKAENKTPEQKALADASIVGDRMTLKADSFIPMTMAVIYVLLLLYFKTIGGYKPLKITPEQAAGGLNGPAEF
ncbi:MFS transporter [Haloferula sp. BvORR071]|uniref:MFS transporter n=1 Tax=Haloferula sp. BvORR071 TaxID=1396141 RepID=UPI00054CF8FB|nr:MFS transporter [Haloferula sp. BvORR071]